MANSHSERFVILVNDARTRIREITAAEVEKKLEADENFVLLDVREQEEWEASAHIPGADFLSKGVIERDIVSECPDIDREIILYCRDGYRSALAADNLRRMGYTNVKSIAGGFRSWTEAGLPIQTNGAESK